MDRKWDDRTPPTSKGDRCVVVCVGCEYAERVRECEGGSNASVGYGGSGVAVSAGHESMDGTHGSGTVSLVQMTC